jgi:type I restriction enzyme M protein
LLRVAKEVKEVAAFYGQESNPTTYNLCRMNMIMHDVHYKKFDIKNEDTLERPQHIDQRFEAIVANPPFSAIWSASPLFMSDDRFSQYGRLAPGSKADFAFVQHMIKSMAPRSGRMAVVLPHGALFRMGKEGEIRQKLLGMDLLEAVIGLGPNLFYGTGLAACILVFRQKKAKDRKNKVLIVDASKEFKTGRAQNELLPEHVERIHGWVRDYTDVEGIARLVTLDEIAANDHNLNIPRYVEPKVTSEVLTVEEAMKRLRESADEAFAAEERLCQLLVQNQLLQ